MYFRRWKDRRNRKAREKKKSRKNIVHLKVGQGEPTTNAYPMQILIYIMYLLINIRWIPVLLTSNSIQILSHTAHLKSCLQNEKNSCPGLGRVTYYLVINIANGNTF